MKEDLEPISGTEPSADSTAIAGALDAAEERVANAIESEDPAAVIAAVDTKYRTVQEWSPGLKEQDS